MRCAISAPSDADVSRHCTTREFRGRHLLLIAFGVWLLGSTSVLLLVITVQQWAVSALAIFFACLFGGAIASALFKASP